jgi:hypothetical protein
MDFGTKFVASPPQGQNGAGGADELRELANKGVCAPLYRNNQAVAQVRDIQQIVLLWYLCKVTKRLMLRGFACGGC